MPGQRSGWRERLYASPSRMEQEFAFKLQQDQISYQTQVEPPVATADFYFSLETRPLVVFVDGRVHLGKSQMIKDEELRSLLRKRGYKILELYYGQLFGYEKKSVVQGNPRQPANAAALVRDPDSLFPNGFHEGSFTFSRIAVNDSSWFSFSP
jgi:very-short-patch-repair endonuclease